MAAQCSGAVGGRACGEREQVEEAIHAFSHDVRSQLIKVAGLAGLLVEPGAEVGDLAARLSAAAQRAQEVLTAGVGLLRLANREARGERLDMDGLVGEAVERADLGAGAVVCDSPLAPAWGDREMVALLLDAVLENSARFGSPDRPLAVRVGSSRSGAGSVFTVADNGRGFDPAQRERAFGAFRGLGQPGEGLGVGLALVRLVATRLGGRAWCDPVPGRGTEVHFSLPAGGPV